MPARLALVAVLACFAPGCVSALVGALGGDAASRKAAADADLALFDAAVHGAGTSGSAAPRATPTADPLVPGGGEPEYECLVPGDDERQRLGASSLAGAVRTCEGMNALPRGGHCACREVAVEEGDALADPAR